MPAPTTAEIWMRFLYAALLGSIVCTIVGYLLLRITGVPSTYPPLLPTQIVAGAVGGALLVTLGYWLLAAVIPDNKMRTGILLTAATLLTVVSFYLPYRLSYTHSLRFAGVTLAAQVGQCLLHVLVVGLSIVCFLPR